MDRVVTYIQHQSLLGELMRTSSKLARTQQQIATGKVGNQFADIAEDAGVLLAAKRTLARSEGYTNTANEIKGRLALQDLHLNTLADQTNTLRMAITDALANNNGIAFMERLDGVFRQAANILNTRIDGRYLYAGTRTDTAPVNVETLADLEAAPTVSSIFDNNDVKPAARIDESQTVEYGLLASDLGAELFTVLKSIATFNSGPDGPISGELTTTQRDFLTAELQNVIGAAENLNLEAAKNGLKQNEVADALVRHEDSGVVLKTLISGIEDVDMAEAITRLNQEQLAQQASARVLAQLNSLTLLDFLE